MSKPPAFWFYTGDWMKDVAVRAVSLAARGLWMDMLCMMWEAPHRGFLETTQGKPYTPAQIARMSGAPVTEVSALLEELERDEVLSKTRSGVIFNRRMKRDEGIRADARERQRRHRNSQQANASTNGAVTCDEDVTEGDGVTGVSPPSSNTSKTSVTSTSKLKTKRFSSRISRPVASNGAIDTGEPSAENLGHARPHDAAAREAETEAPTFALEASGAEAQPAQATFGHQSRHLHAGVIKSLFAHFCKVCGHDPARYTLTPQRLKKALLRLQEQIKLTGSLAQAIEDFKTAISNLAASEYHRTHGYLDWEAQIFRSREEFEKRLAMKPTTPTEVSHGAPRFESIEQHNARVLRETNARLDK